MWIYQQSTGKLFAPDGKALCYGYSGSEDRDGKNNPKKQRVVGIGPIPRGDWVIGDPYDSKNVGPFALPLSPHNHDACNRAYFRIHGDSRFGNASKGCVILPKNIRKKIHQSNDRIFKVIE